jgi:hypothetical protein
MRPGVFPSGVRLDAEPGHTLNAQCSSCEWSSWLAVGGFIGKDMRVILRDRHTKESPKCDGELQFESKRGAAYIAEYGDGTPGDSL